MKLASISPGRTVGIAVLLLLMSAFLDSFPSTSGTVNFVETGIKVVCMSVMLTPLFVPIIAFHFWFCYRSPLAGICKPGMRRVLMLLPYGCLFLVTLIHAIQHWPTPATYFERYFKQHLPPTASNVSLRPSTLADAGHVGFYFEADAAAIHDLIARLRLDKLNAEADFEMIFNIAGKVNPSTEAGFEFWERSDNRGTGYLLAHHPQRGEVFVARYPGWAKSDEDLGRTTSRFPPDE